MTSSVPQKDMVIKMEYDEALARKLADKIAMRGSCLRQMERIANALALSREHSDKAKNDVSMFMGCVVQMDHLTSQIRHLHDVLIPNRGGTSNE